MINQNDIAEIVNEGKSDGIRLLNVSSKTYTTLIVFNWILAIGGLFGSVAMFSNVSAVGGFVFAIGTLIFCAITYAVAVLSTHIAKVLVHLLFANLAMLEKEQK